MQFERSALLAALVLLGAIFGAAWIRSASRAPKNDPGAGGSDATPRAPSRVPSVFLVAVGFVTDFLDTLGIGSFATTASLFRLGRQVDDRVIPGTMNVGHAIPTIVQAVIFITIVRVETTTLIVMIAASVAGAWFGAGLVATWPRRAVRVAMGTALVLAATLLAAGSLGWVPAGGEQRGLGGIPLVVAVAGNFLFGALMTFGVGLYAPCMLLVSLLGMNPEAAFPIMMGSCAFLMLVSGFRFFAHRAYEHRAALGLTLGGVPGVLLAAFAVRSLPLAALRWLVVAVATYTAITLLTDAAKTEVPKRA